MLLEDLQREVSDGIDTRKKIVSYKMVEDDEPSTSSLALAAKINESLKEGFELYGNFNVNEDNYASIRQWSSMATSMTTANPSSLIISYVRPRKKFAIWPSSTSSANLI